MTERVSCVTKGESHKYSDCRCITAVGTTTGRRYSREQAHDMVKASPGCLYVERSGSRANLVPGLRDGVKYVRTSPNDTPMDNLIQLPNC